VNLDVDAIGDGAERRVERRHALAAVDDLVVEDIEVDVRPRRLPAAGRLGVDLDVG
jgi:hypothetical protein